MLCPIPNSFKSSAICPNPHCSDQMHTDTHTYIHTSRSMHTPLSKYLYLATNFITPSTNYSGYEELMFAFDVYLNSFHKNISFKQTHKRYLEMCLPSDVQDLYKKNNTINTINIKLKETEDPTIFMN